MNVGFIVNESVGFSREFEFDQPEIQLEDDLRVENFSGNALFERTQRGLIMTARFSGRVINQCARCLDDITQPLAADFTELFAFHAKDMDESELMVPESGVIDLTPLVREYLLLDFPITPLCKPDCAGLCPVCGTNWNHAKCDCKTETIDPRLSKLKDLLEKDE